MERWSYRPLPGWPLGGDEIRWGVGAVTMCLLGVQAFAVVWASGALGAIYGGDEVPDSADRPIGQLLLLNAGLWLGYFFGPYVVKRVTDSGVLRDFDLRTSPIQAVAAVIIGIAAQLVLLPVLYWLVLLVVDGDPGATAEALIDRVDGALDVTALVVAVVLIAPIVEEWFYRGMVLPTISRRFGLVAGVVISSLVFALIHGELILVPGLFSFAVILAWLTVTTGRIGPAIVAHMAFNATTVVQLLA